MISANDFFKTLDVSNTCYQVQELLKQLTL